MCIEFQNWCMAYDSTTIFVCNGYIVYTITSLNIPGSSSFIQFSAIFFKNSTLNKKGVLNEDQGNLYHFSHSEQQALCTISFIIRGGTTRLFSTIYWKSFQNLARKIPKVALTLPLNQTVSNAY